MELLSCTKCRGPIPEVRIENARRTGMVPQYCDTRCRNAAKQERHRRRTPVTRQDRIHLRNLAAHGMIAEKLLHDPEGVLGIARENIRRWRALNGTIPALDEWELLLDTGDIYEIARILLSIDAEGMRMRSSSPFAGVLDETERALVFAQAERA